MKIAGKAGSHSYRGPTAGDMANEAAWDIFQGGAYERIFRKIKARGSLRREV